MKVPITPTWGQNLYLRNPGCNMKHPQTHTSFYTRDTLQVVCPPAGYTRNLGISIRPCFFTPFFTPDPAP
jgi:hypothetical protein